MSHLQRFLTTIRAQTDTQLIELAKLTNADMSDEADIVIDALISELQTRLPEREFVSLCAELENL